MGSASTKFTPKELESIFIWDLICEALPLTQEERQEINGRDSAPDSGKRKHRAKAVTLPKTAEEIQKEEERKRHRLEQKRLWREANKEHIREKDAAYRAKNRESINERQREYDRAKRASEKATRISSQP